VIAVIALRVMLGAWAHGEAGDQHKAALVLCGVCGLSFAICAALGQTGPAFGELVFTVIGAWVASKTRPEVAPTPSAAPVPVDHDQKAA
jgi:hypothetical protein